MRRLSLVLLLVLVSVTGVAAQIPSNTIDAATYAALLPAPEPIINMTEGFSAITGAALFEFNLQAAGLYHIVISAPCNEYDSPYLHRFWTVNRGPNLNVEIDLSNQRPNSEWDFYFVLPFADADVKLNVAQSYATCSPANIVIDLLDVNDIAIPSGYFYHTGVFAAANEEPVVLDPVDLYPGYTYTASSAVTFLSGDVAYYQASTTCLVQFYLVIQHFNPGTKDRFLLPYVIAPTDTQNVTAAWIEAQPSCTVAMTGFFSYTVSFLAGTPTPAATGTPTDIPLETATIPPTYTAQPTYTPFPTPTDGGPTSTATMTPLPGTATLPPTPSNTPDPNAPTPIPIVLTVVVQFPTNEPMPGPGPIVLPGTPEPAPGAGEVDFTPLQTAAAGHEPFASIGKVEGMLEGLTSSMTAAGAVEANCAAYADLAFGLCWLVDMLEPIPSWLRWFSRFAAVMLFIRYIRGRITGSQATEAGA